MKHFKQHEKLVSQNKMLQQQVSELLKLNLENQGNNEELGQYRRRLCLRIDVIRLKSNETSENISDSVKNLFELAKVNIPDLVLDCAHGIGHIYKDRSSNKNCKGLIVRFTTFRHRTMLYRARSKLKGVKVRLDLRKYQNDL